MSGHFEIPRIRSQGRKIETWTFHGADDKATIDVALRTGKDGMHFSATSAHPALAGKTWSGTDIALLAETVEAEVAGIFTDLQSERWRPGVILEVLINSLRPNGPPSVSLSISSDPVLVDSQSLQRNDGKRRIQKSGSTAILQERIPSDETHHTFGNQSIKITAGGSRGIVSDTPEIRAAIADLQATISAFADLLSQATSPPARPDPDAIPTPEDLVEMMRKAASGAAR